MKIKDTDYKILKEGIADNIESHLLEYDNIEAMYNYVMMHDKKSNDYKMRVRWSLMHRFDDLYIASNKVRFTKTLYTYLNDSHVDTALKSIMNELQKEGY